MPEPNRSTARVTVDEYLKRITAFGFAGACLVAKGEHVISNAGYGLAIRDRVLSNTAETVFSLGSLTKQFTASAIVKLEEQGELATDDPISRFLSAPADKSEITLHQLLTHSSGLALYSGDDYEPASREEALAAAFSASLRFEPGTQYGYSNAGYSVLAAVIEVVTRVTYEDYLRAALFDPAGLESTGYVRPNWSERLVAHWYAGAIDNGTPLERPYPSWHIVGNGEMLSTTADVFRWIQALRNGSVLSSAALDKLLTPYVDRYGYGWRIEDTEHGRLVTHGGASTLGASAVVNWFTEEDMLVVILCNHSYGSSALAQTVEDEVTAASFGRVVAVPPPVDEAEYSHMWGRYDFPDGSGLAVSHTTGGVLIEAIGQQAVDRLMFGGESVPAMQDLNRRAERLVVSSEALWQEVSGDDERFARYRDYIAAAKAEELGDDVAATVTAPTHLADVVATRVRLGDKALLVYWQDSRLFGLGEADDDDRYGMVFARGRSCAELVGFHLSRRRVAHLRFEQEALVLTVNGNACRARRAE